MDEYFDSLPVKYGFDAWKFLDQGEVARILLDLSPSEIRDLLDFIEALPLGNA